MRDFLVLAGLTLMVVAIPFITSYFQIYSKRKRAQIITAPERQQMHRRLLAFLVVLFSVIVGLGTAVMSGL